MAATMLKPVLFLFALLFLISPARAQHEHIIPDHLPDALYMVFTGPNNFEDKQSVTFTLKNDRPFCESKFGKSWYTACSNNNRRLGLDGKKVEKGININPPMKGEWRWTSDFNLRFTPESYWQAGVNYGFTFELDEMGVPPHVVINGKDRRQILTASSNSLGFKITQMKYMQDPDDPARKLIAAHISANYPVEAADFKKHIAVAFEEGNNKELKQRDGGRDFEFTPQPHNMGAQIAVILKSLPNTEQALRLLVKEGVKPIHGGSASKIAFTERTRIPTLDSYLTLQSPSLSIARLEDGTPEQTFSFSTNAKARTKDVQEKIKLYLLPEQHPVMARDKTGQKPDDFYEWKAENEVTPEILAQATTIKLEDMRGATEYNTHFGFPVTVPAGRYIYLHADKSLEAFGGYILGGPVTAIMRAPAWPHDLEIMQEGSIMSLSGNRKLSLHARGTDKLSIEVAHIKTDSLQHFISQTYGDIREPEFRNWSFGPDDIATLDTKTLSMNFESPQAAQYTAFDFAPYLQDDRKGLFLLKINGERNGKMVGTTRNRFVLVTDMGLLVKEGRKNTRDIYLMSFADGKAVADATVRVLGRNGLPVFSGKTDTSGHVMVPDLSESRRDHEPVAIIAEKGADFSFIPYERDDRILNMSAFDVGGAVIPAEGLNAFLFTDRGIYRPGETAHIGMMVRNADWLALPASLPLQVIITDPRGRTVIDKIINFDTGLKDIPLPTTETSATGTYRAQIHIPGTDYPGTMLGSTSFKVQDFQPDRLKIKTVFEPAESKGWIKPEGLEAHVTLTNLYGTPATKRKISGSVTLNPAEMSFPGFSDFKFYDSYAAVPRTIEYELPESETDDKGKAVLPLNVDKQEKFTYSLNLQTRGFEAGSGRGVTAYATALVSPMDYAVGYKTDANLNFLRKDQDYNIDLTAVDSELQSMALPHIKRELIRRSFVSTLVRRNNGSYAYESVPREETIKTDKFEILTGGSVLKIPTAETGTYTYRLRNKDNLVISEINFAVTGAGGQNNGRDREAVLDLRIDKERYSQGENIEVSITAPYIGAGLITLESDHVIAHKWFKTDSTETIQTIAVPKEFSGKGYVSVAFVRDINAHEIYMTPLSHATVPFIANTETHTADIELSVPKLVQPGQPVTVKYKGNSKGKAIIYAVDEGILQVARYKTPDPIDFFLLNRALQVRTSQMLDLLMPEFDLVRELSATGGDAQAEDAALGKHLNPFKRKTLAPAIYWSGVVDIDTTERTVTFTPPGHFNGQMRVMAVAVTDTGVGSADEDMNVRGPLVVTPNLPLFMAPGDTASVSVTVANNTGTDGDLKLAMTTTPGLTVLDAPETINVQDGQEETISFNVRANDHLGSGSLTVSAAQGVLNQDAEATISIRPPTPLETTMTVGYADKGRADFNLSRDMYPQLAERSLSISPLPNSYIAGLSRYLDKFPYGCTEQIISRTLPHLSLHDRPEFMHLADDTAADIQHTIDTLRLRQNYEGGFSLWSSGDRVDDFATIYALDFLITAMENGHKVPARMVEDGIRYVRDAVNRDISTFEQAYITSYGIYILTRSGIVTSNEILHLLKYFEDSKKSYWQSHLIAAYIAASYKLMQQSELAEDTLAHLEKNMSPAEKPWKNEYWAQPWYSDFISHARYISLVARHFPERIKDIDPNVVFKLASFVQERRYNTLSASYAIQALADYDRVAGSQMIASAFTVEVDDKKLTMGDDMTSPLPVSAEKIDIKAKKRQGLFYSVSESGYDRNIPADSTAKNIEIDRVYKTPDGKEWTGDVAVGDIVMAEITLRTHGGETIPNIAVVDLLPGGFEMDADDTGEGSTMATAYVERREDRIIAFTTALEDPRILRYRMRAVSRGTYIVPPPFAESMYDLTTKARGRGSEITVIDAP